MTVFERLLAVLASGMPPAACLGTAAMVLAGEPSLHERALRDVTGMHPVDVQHMAMYLRTRRRATYKAGVLTLTDPELLKLLDDVRAQQKRPKKVV